MRNLCPDCETIHRATEPCATVNPLDPVETIPAYAVIIRAIWERGTIQTDAIHELACRGLWLHDDQVDQAELVKLDQYPWYKPKK